MNFAIQKVLESFQNVKVLVIGDVMLDRYWFGKVTRISPEAPVPIVNLDKETFIIGGAANVAANIKGLGAFPFLLGIIGDDEAGNIFNQKLEDCSISSENIIKVANRPTTLKTRVIANHQQIARIDNETKNKLSVEDESIVWEKIVEIILQVDIVIISDYGKGLVNQSLTQKVIKKSNQLNKKILIDPKGTDYDKYQNATLLTPNKKEAFESSGVCEVNEAGRKLLDKLNLKSLLITQGEDGMSIFESDNKIIQLEAVARHVYDVTGAGDTVIATLAVALAAGGNLYDSAFIANVAAGYVVEEIGTTAISFNKLKSHFEITI